MRLRTLLRPSILASVVLHAAVVAAGALAVGGPMRDRDPRILSFLSSEDVGTVDAADVPPLPPPLEPQVEAVPLPRPEEDALPDEPAEPQLEARADVPADSPVLDRIPVGVRTRPRRPPAPLPSPVAASAPPSAASRVGVGRTVDAIGRRENLPPLYPDEARARGWSGTVVLEIVVRADGAVGEVRVRRSSGYAALDEAALAAARAWRYDPRLVDGVPAPDRLLVDVTFRLVER